MMGLNIGPRSVLMVGARRECVGQAESTAADATFTLFWAIARRKVCWEVFVVITLTPEEESRLEELLREMTLEEKAAQIGAVTVKDLLGDNGELSRAKMKERLKYGIGQVARIAGWLEIPPTEAARFANEIQRFLRAETRLGIPAIVHEECLSGLMAMGATVFPQAIGLGSTWDPQLIRRMTDVIRQQARALGTNYCLSPVLDLGWDPRWGRTEETMGEDPYLISRMTTAYVQGLQGDNLREGILSCLKHYVGNSFSEGGRNLAPARIPSRELREVFLFPYQVAITEGGAGSVMSAYHEIDGIPCSASPELLTEVLRNQWGFDGVVVADYGTITMLQTEHYIAGTKAEAAKQALEAGLDVELPDWDYYAEPLINAVRAGEIDESLVDRSVRRHLRLKLALGLFDEPFVDEASAATVFDMPQHRALSREVARCSIVLLKNEKDLLPLSSAVKSIAVVGPNADSTTNLMGDYSYPVHVADSPDGVDIITILEGIRAKVSAQTEVRSAQGCEAMSDSTEGFAEAIKAAQDADVVVAVVGDESGMHVDGTTGENLDRTEITLPGAQEELLKALYETGTPLVVVLVNGRPLSSPWMFENVPAIVEAWMPGEEGGNAVADVLFGDYNPGGKLSVSILVNSGQIPAPYNRRPLAFRPYIFNTAYPLLPFGHGLSYTDFKYSNLRIAPQQVGEEAEVSISCTVANIGKRGGDEVVQLYLRDVVASLTRPNRELKGFARVGLEPGEKKTVTFTLPMDLLAFYDRDMRMVVEPGEFKVMVGSSSADIRLEGSFEVTAQRLVDPNSRRLATEVAVE